MSNTIIQQLGKIDIYLLDQILKNRIHPSMRLLDAGCGMGRNAQYFIQNNFDIRGIDKDPTAIQYLQSQAQQWNPTFDPNRFQIGDLLNIPFPNQHFDFIISSAVLHFADNRAHFLQLLNEHYRVLEPTGILWFRMTTKHTLEEHAQHLQDDVYALPDGSTRYLLDVNVLTKWMTDHRLQFLDPFKTVNVSDLRTMSVVVLKKLP